MKSKSIKGKLVMGLTAVQADAQALRGFRAEGQVGITSFHSEGNSDSHVGWGAAAGVDAFVANNFVLGAEGQFWWAPAENHTSAAQVAAAITMNRRRQLCDIAHAPGSSVASRAERVPKNVLRKR